jgi:hypothetical protein
MLRWCACLALWAVAATAAPAHFIWIVPDDPAPGKVSAKAVFSDTLQPDRPELLEKIGVANFVASDAAGVSKPLRATKGEQTIDLVVNHGGPVRICGTCRYGVSQRGASEPTLLFYYPSAYVGATLGDRPAPALQLAPPQSPLYIVQAPGQGGMMFEVRWNQKPLPETEVFALHPGEDTAKKHKTDAAGRFSIENPRAGLYGFRVGYLEPKGGELDGVKYKGVRHYATLVVRRGEDSKKGPAAAALKADAEATKLLADARAARASWENFPGFAADVEANFDGKVVTGRVEVSRAGKVSLSAPDPGAPEWRWVLRQLGSIVSHRLGNAAELQTPCAFADDVKDHPFGRAIRVLNDEFHSSYRIHDRQILVVNRQMEDSRFTITVLENRLNAEKQFLPAHYVVNTWDRKTGALMKTETFHQTWQRVGRFDLPSAEYVVTATAGKLEDRRLKLSNHQLLP